MSAPTGRQDHTSAGLHPTCDCEFSLRNVVSSIGVLPGEKRLGGAWRVRNDDDGAAGSGIAIRHAYDLAYR